MELIGRHRPGGEQRQGGLPRLRHRSRIEGSRRGQEPSRRDQEVAVVRMAPGRPVLTTRIGRVAAPSVQPLQQPALPSWRRTGQGRGPERVNQA